MKLEKAEIIGLDRSGRPAIRVPVMYNPEEISTTSSSEISGQGSNLQFHRLNREDLSVSLFFDSYEEGSDVKKRIKPIEDLMAPTIAEKNVKRPPICIFRWGDFEYRGVIIRVERTFIMFLASGVPVRARVTVQFKSILSPSEDLKSMGREACRKLWLVRAGDRLDLIAAEALSDSGQWALIARANRIDEPLFFPRTTDIGRTIVIPDVTENA